MVVVWDGLQDLSNERVLLQWWVINLVPSMGSNPTAGGGHERNYALA